MRPNTVFARLTDFINRSIITIYRYFRNKPSTAVDFVQWWGAGEEFNLLGLPAWKKTIKMDRKIDELIKQYGITHFRTQSLYEVCSTYYLIQAFRVIELGFVKPDDFTFANPISKIFSKKELFAIDNLGKTDFFGSWLGSDDVLNAARKAATTEECYNDLRMAIASYKSSIDICKYFTKQIQDVEKEFGLSNYIGKNLYDIGEEELLKEALAAIPKIWLLGVEYAIDRFNGEHISMLSKFGADKCLRLVRENKTEGVEFNQVRKQRKEEKKRLDEVEDTKREMHNTAARERRAKAKAEKEKADKIIVITYSKKAHLAKIKKEIAESEKARQAAKPATKNTKSVAVPALKKKAAPGKKVQPKKKANQKVL